MSRILLIAAAFAVTTTLAHAGGPGRGHHKHRDVKAVKKVIVDAYVIGGHTKSDTEAMRAGFHEKFVMLVRGKDGTLRQVTRDSWLARIDKHNAEPDKAKPAKVRHKFLRVDVTGNVAVAQIAIYKNSEHIFTDYMSLYRFDDGWKIVAKVFQSHGK